MIRFFEEILIENIALAVSGKRNTLHLNK